jgi:hypothetical protein
LNYGLRWDVSQPFYEERNRLPTIEYGLQSSVYPGAPTGWVFPGDPGIPASLAPTRYDDFAPRLGFAYSPGANEGLLGKILGGPGKTSIRGAYGIFYQSIENQGLDFQIGQDPFSIYYSSPALVYFEQPYKARTSGNNPG